MDYLPLKEAIKLPPDTKTNIEAKINYVGKSKDIQFEGFNGGIVNKKSQFIYLENKPSDVSATILYDEGSSAPFDWKDKGKIVYLNDAKVESYEKQGKEIKTVRMKRYSFDKIVKDVSTDKINEALEESAVESEFEPPLPAVTKRQRINDELALRDSVSYDALTRAIQTTAQVLEENKGIFEYLQKQGGVDVSAIIDTVFIFLSKYPLLENGK